MSDKNATKGMKFDNNKLDPCLLLDGMPYSIEEIDAVLKYGADKYDKHNWKKVEGAVERYRSAAFRHLMAISKGEIYDKESGMRHLTHAITSLLFVAELTKEDINLNLGKNKCTVQKQN